ncbi:hypothetical protein E2562_034732 [Oryza meyeriana var. granulata]|uniref:Uncharacterized protein n=1 Tax=Oryza meyeriana var. granulata TaxID=110450 RepID=A0A6G1CBT2_9ORYZ|nr:hypothetical protein E2562_034732 [Oryza meyeriana var. granulata]
MHLASPAVGSRQGSLIQRSVGLRLVEFDWPAARLVRTTTYGSQCVATGRTTPVLQLLAMPGAHAAPAATRLPRATVSVSAIVLIYCRRVYPDYVMLS